MKLALKWAGPITLLLICACAVPAEEQDAVTSTVSALASSKDPAPTGAASSSAARAVATTPAGKGQRARVVHRSRKDPNAKRHSTGRREMTREDLELYEKSVPKVVGVRPTQLLVERVREAQGKTAASAATTTDIAELEAAVVPNGSELVIAAPGERSALAAIAEGMTLPPSVDNSTSQAFPEIRNQEGIGSCVAFAVGYYQYTYALGKLLGWNNKNAINTTKVSPKFLYNLANWGEDGGTSAYMVHRILEEHGALTWSEFPYSGDALNPVNYRAWPTSSTQWKSALRYKSMGPADVGNPTDPATLELAKSLLANGQVLTFSTYIYSWEFEQLDDDPSTSADNGLVGQYVATWQDGYDGGHEATIVGYDDRVWVDLNANGTVESGEKGAFKVANSWGPNWMNSGYVWVAYDALQYTSQVPNGPASENRSALMGSVTALLSARTNYQPQLLAEFTVSTASRGELSLSLRQTELDRTDPVDEFYTPLFAAAAGSYAYDGTVTTQAKSASFALDLSQFALSYGDLVYRLHGENFSPTAASISNLSLTDRLRNNLKTTTTDPTAVIAMAQAKSQGVRYKFQDPARVPRLTVTPSASSIDFGTLALGQSALRQLTVQNTGTGDLAVSSMRFGNPLFLVKGQERLRLAPGASWTFDLEFAPASSQQETTALSLRNTSTNQSNATFTLSGGATSNSASAPYQVFITQQNDPTDNSLSFRAEIKSRVPTTTALSDYQFVYYLNDPGLDPASVQWETFYSNVGAIEGSVKRVFLTRELGPRKADLALTLRFPASATLAPYGSAIVQGTLRRADYSWYPNENDDWSRFLRRDGMAEGTIFQQRSTSNVLFGLPAEAPSGAQQLSVSPNPTTGQATVTFVLNDASTLNTSIGVYFYSDLGEIQYIERYWVSSLGNQSFSLDVSWFPPGRYTVVLQGAAGRLDAFPFMKQ